MPSQTVLQRLGKRVRELRTERDLTQEQLADRAGITWGYVSAIERATKSATIETLTAIAKGLDVSLSELFLDVDQDLPKELQRIQAAFAGRSTVQQKLILKVLEDALKLSMTS